MKIQYNPPEEKYYISPDHFVATDDKVRLVVIDSEFQFQYYNSVTNQYEVKEFYTRQDKIEMSTIVGLVNAYQNRKNKEHG